MQVSKNRIIRALYFLSGTLCVILGFIGAFLPLLPTTPFILLAAFFFMRSSEKAHQWLYRQPLIGTALINWEKNKAIAPRAKITAIALIGVSLYFVWIRVPLMPIKIGITIMLLCSSTYIVTRNNR
ncbi:YbaN family protein [bacterium]|nr:YbaN family protein [bacterium]